MTLIRLSSRHYGSRVLVAVNGVTTLVPTDIDYDAAPEVVSALAESNKIWRYVTDPGNLTGRIRVDFSNGIGGVLSVGLNGRTLLLPIGFNIPASDSLRSLLDDAGITFTLAREFDGFPLGEIVGRDDTPSPPVDPMQVTGPNPADAFIGTPYSQEWTVVGGIPPYGDPVLISGSPPAWAEPSFAGDKFKIEGMPA